MNKNDALPPSLLIALGGNAITHADEVGDIKDQYRHTIESLSEIVDLLRRGQQRLLITHGNGPQVGNILLRAELASSVLYPLPLDVCVADSQGGMGYMIQQVLDGLLRRADINRTAATVMTQVLVAGDDPAFKNPTKYIGRTYSTEEASMLITTRNWRMKEDRGRKGWRRVVPSPTPLDVVELEAISILVGNGIIAIAGGGGGIPVIKNEDGSLTGVEAVVDKDITSALLAARLGLDTLLILSGVEKVCLGFGTAREQPLDELTVAEARHHLVQGEFPEGSMAPKIRAACWFLENGGNRAIISEVGRACAALSGRTGTHFRV